MSSSGPSEQPVYDEAATAAPARGTEDTAAPADTPTDRGEGWPGRRRPGRRERGLIGAAMVVLVGYLTVTLGAAIWSMHPAISALGVICGAGSLGLLVASFWARRPLSTSFGPSLRELPDATRKSLLEDLRAGRPGPADLRPYAVAWTCLNLQAPWTQAPLLAVAASNAGVSAGGPVGPVTLVLVVLVPLLWAVSTAGWARRRRAAHRVANALDQLTPPPHSPPPAPIA